MRWRPVEIFPENADLDVQPKQIEVEDRFSGRVTIQGVQARKAIPFVGDPRQLGLRPNPYGLNPPRASIGSSAITILMVAREGEDAQIIAYFAQTEDAIVGILAAQRPEIDKFKACSAPPYRPKPPPYDTFLFRSAVQAKSVRNMIDPAHLTARGTRHSGQGLAKSS